MAGLGVGRAQQQWWAVPTLQGYLATIDEKVSSIQLDEMKAHRIYLVMPEGIIAKKEHYAAADNIITFEIFFQYHLDPAVERWKASNII